MNTHVSTEESEPFFFDAADQQLFGNYHPPAAANRRNSAVVLCYPLGDEYIRAHRAYRQLAIRLARAGFPVLRFDYFGSGDSAGNDVDVRIERWLADIAAAIGEVKRRSGAQTIYLGGLRLGATLAALAAAQHRVAGLVLWEPVINGSAFIQQVTEWHEQKLRYFARQPVKQSGSVIEEVTERLGFVFSAGLLADIQALDLMVVTQKPAEQIFIMEQTPQEQFKHLGAHLTTLGSQIDYQQIDGPIIWREDVDKALIPNQNLQAIINWISKRDEA